MRRDVHVLDLRAGADAQLAGYREPVARLSWDCAGRQLATSDGDAVTLWNCTGLPALALPRRLIGLAAPSTVLRHQRRGALLAAADESGLLVIWDPPRSALPVATHRLDHPVWAMSWLCGDSLLGAVTSAGSVRVFAVPGRP